MHYIHTYFKNFYLPMKYGHGCNDALFTNTVPTSARDIPELRYNSSICRIFYNLIVIMRIPVEPLLDQGLE